MSQMSREIMLIGDGAGIPAATAAAVDERDWNASVTSRSGNHPAFDATSGAVDFPVPDVLDGFVYFPGTINLKPFHRLTTADFERDYQINVLGAVRTLQHCLPALKKSSSPSIVLFSSVAAQTGMGFHASIGSAKAAIEGLTRSLAAEFAPKIRVNAIAPSLTETPMAEMFLNSETKAQAARERHPLKAVGRAGDIAELVCFLLGDASRFMTGQILHPDGGMSSVRQF